MDESRRTVVIVGLVLLVVAVIGAVFLFTHNKAEAPTLPSDETADGATATVITYTDNGFSPASITVLVGANVTWKNESSRSMWIYPSDDGEDYCLGQDAPTSFNQCASVATGESYSYTFTEPGIHAYVNQENRGDKAEVRVQERSFNPDAIPQ